MKRIVVGSSLAVALLLAGCGSEEAAPQAEKKETAKAESVEKKVETKEVAAKEEKQVEKSDAGVKTVQYTNKDVGIKADLGPLKFSINKIQTARLKVNPDFKQAFGNKDDVTLIIIQTTTENTIDDTISMYPNQATITTNTGEQIKADIVLSEDSGGEFIGKVKKTGSATFLAESQPEDITSVKFIMEGPHDDKFTKLAERYTVEIPTKK